MIKKGILFLLVMVGLNLGETQENEADRLAQLQKQLGYVKHKNFEVRRNLPRAIVPFTDKFPEAVAALYFLLTDSEEMVTLAAFENVCLGRRFQEPTLKETLELGLNHKHNAVKIKALDFLVSEFSKQPEIASETLSWLNKAFQDKSGIVSAKALKLLIQSNEIDKDKKASLLKEAFQKNTKEVQLEAIRLIWVLKRKKEFVVDLVQTLKSIDLEVKIASIKTLGDMGSSANEAVPLLEEALKDPLIQVQEEAKAALEKITAKFTEKKIHPLFANRLSQKNKGEIKKNIMAGLTWLSNHQHPEGFWDADDFMKQCSGNACEGKGKAWTDVGLTGMALLAFLGDGHTRESEEFSETVVMALHYLQKVQLEDGCIGPTERGAHYMYNHLIANLALIEASVLHPEDKEMSKRVQKGITFIVQAQNTGKPLHNLSGWRYEPQSGDNDTSVTSWAVINLVLAKEVGNFQVPPESLSEALQWLNEMTDDKFYRTGYMKKGDPGARLAGLEGKFAPSEAMTAAALTSKLFMNVSLKEKNISGGMKLLMEGIPDWDLEGKIVEPKNTGGGKPVEKKIGSRLDFYYWYYGSLATFHYGDKEWKSWSGNIKKALLKNQKTKDCESGSWDPIDAWGTEGGRIYSTAMNILILETPLRYKKISTLYK